MLRFAAQYAAARRRAPVAAYRRHEVFERWGGRCVYCNGAAAHLDHIQPLSRGGKDIPSNVAPACARCNLSKADQTLSDWALTWL